MSATPANSKPSFFKSHVLPVLFIFLIPGFSVWFFAHTESSTDEDVLKQLERSIQEDSKLSSEERRAALEFYRAVPVSKIMAARNPEAAEMQAMFEPVELRYATFRWMKRIAWICLGTVAATFLIVGLSVVWSLRSQAAQFNALRIGLPVLKLSAAIQVLGQGVLAVALSFWVTAWFFEVYFIKLIGIIGLLAAFAVFSLWKAIFSRIPDDQCEVDGDVVTEADAPSLWQRVREMAAKLNTATPDRIVVGIVPSFFVTEHPVVHAGEVLHGRTLYLSLPLLKVLAAEEADAVLGHELAHFSGQDTLWSRKISPLTAKFMTYLGALAVGFSMIVAHFMLFFWKLYSLSMRRLSRAREFLADQVGAGLSSGQAMKRALVKTTCYCEYRNKTEAGIFEKSRVDQSLNLPLQLEQGYPTFLTSFMASDESIGERVPHPFDTHPTLHNRLEHLGFDPKESLSDPLLQQPAQDSWYQAIGSASSMEERMWKERQDALQKLHSLDIAWRLMPKNEEEIALVREHFPQLVFRDKKGAEATLEFDRIHITGWPETILFKDIETASAEDSTKGKKLTLAHSPPGQDKTKKTAFYAASFVSEKGDLLTFFGQYYTRHLNARLEVSAEAKR